MSPHHNYSHRLYADGACRGNPGHGAAGAVLTDGDGNVLHQWGRYLGVCTNNIAEYEALLLGVRSSLALGLDRIQILLDSELLVRQVKGEYRVKNDRLRELMKELRGLLSLLADYDIRHVPREQNRLADTVANAALNRGLQEREAVNLDELAKSGKSL